MGELSPEMIAAGWVPHDGSECPVAGAQWVSVLFRSPDSKPTRHYHADAWDWRWSRSEPSGDIIAYKPEIAPMTDIPEELVERVE